MTTPDQEVNGSDNEEPIDDGIEIQTYSEDDSTDDGVEIITKGS